MDRLGDILKKDDHLQGSVIRGSRATRLRDGKRKRQETGTWYPPIRYVRMYKRV